MLPVSNKLGNRVRIKRLTVGLSRKEMAKCLGGKPSPRTIFNIEMGSQHEQTPETLRMVRSFLKLDVQAIILRVKNLGIKPKETRGNPGRKKKIL